jgi:hypothetical protein
VAVRAWVARGVMESMVAMVVDGDVGVGER